MHMETKLEITIDENWFILAFCKPESPVSWELRCLSAW